MSSSLERLNVTPLTGLGPLNHRYLCQTLLQHIHCNIVTYLISSAECTLSSHRDTTHLYLPIQQQRHVCLCRLADSHSWLNAQPRPERPPALQLVIIRSRKSETTFLAWVVRHPRLLCASCGHDDVGAGDAPLLALRIALLDGQGPTSRGWIPFAFLQSRLGPNILRIEPSAARSLCAKERKSSLTTPYRATQSRYPLAKMSLGRY